jgi:hypothetical protein
VGEDEESVKACLVSILAVVAAAGCSTTRLSEDSRRPLWVLWAVHQNYINDPEILRPMETYTTRAACDARRWALIEILGETLDAAERQNRGRELKDMVFPRNLIVKPQCWPATVDPR